jgi:kinetochore protein NDC80
MYPLYQPTFPFSYRISRLDKTNANHPIRYEQLTLKANALREELHTEIERMLNDIIKFKVHVQKNLEDYESFVADELEKELVPDKMSEDEEEDDEI